MVRMDATASIDTMEDDRPSNILEQFAESEEVLTMIANLQHSDHNTDRFEKAYERFSEIVGRYQEQPHLLDSNLSQLIENLLLILRDSNNPLTLFHGTFKYLYQLAKVRSPKALVKFLPHEVTDLEFVLNLLEKQSITDTVNWETKYFLMLWLSILVLNPFHMSRLDSFSAESIGSVNHHELTVMERIFQLCLTYCNSNDTCSSIAAVLASRYLVRIDVKDTYLPRFLNWAIESNRTDITRMNNGQLSAIAAILKHGKREDLIPHSRMLLHWTLNCNYKDASDFLKQKFVIKIIQRLGLVFLKPRLACWRYQRGSRSLTTNLGGSTVQSVEFQNSSLQEVEKDSDMDVPEEIEDVIEELLQALRNSSGDIRWSAAKGLGRVTNRLPKTLGDEVVGSVIDIFSPLEPHEGWHGGCLAIAELAKRGLLLPCRLQAMVPILMKALVYDEMKGYMSVGQHIRDAACYMSWAFARAYEPSDLQPFIHKIASGLLVTTVFDREINCRRAASAAFQESVGRLGNFPHGIDILVEADFYSVGLRSNSYLIISDFIAQYEEYTYGLIDHLIERKINHWDTSIRELTARTLFKLVKRAPKYVADTILPTLFAKTDSIDINLRHGSILAIGETILSLSEFEQQHNLQGNYLNRHLIDLVNGLVIKFQNKDLFRGLSGDIMHQACCDFIRNCSKARVSATVECIESWQDIIDSCIIKKSAQIRDVAFLALSDISEAYYCTIGRSEDNAQMVLLYRLGCKNDLEENIRMGYVSALGSLPAYILKPNLREIIMTLVKYSLTPCDQLIVLSAHEMADCQNENLAVLKWSEARRDSIKALSNVVHSIGFNLNDCESMANPEYLDLVFECLFKGLEEYTIDDRGDIGAWVREASMNALFSLVTTCPPNLLQPEVVHTIMTGLAQQAVEIIDRTRGLAGNLFCKIVHWTPTIPHIQHHEFLKDLFPNDSSSVLWLFADHTFPLFCAMLELPEYSEKLVLGLVASIGKLSESLIKHSSASMFQFLRSHSHHIPRICDQIIEVFKKHLHDKRISHPMLNFLDSIMSSGTITEVLLDESLPYSDEIFRLVKLEMKGQKNIYKLASCANIFCHLIQIPRLCTKALSTLAVFLGQVHVHVRKSAATKLYEVIVLHGEGTSIPEENIDEILTLLSETDWGLPLNEIRPIRNHLCDLLGIKAPMSVTSSTVK